MLTVFFLPRYGDLDVLVEVKKEDRTKKRLRMKIKKFLSRYEMENWYVVTVLPDEMRHELQVSLDKLLYATHAGWCNLNMPQG